MSLITRGIPYGNLREAYCASLTREKTARFQRTPPLSQFPTSYTLPSAGTPQARLLAGITVISPAGLTKGTLVEAHHRSHSACPALCPARTLSSTPPRHTPRHLGAASIARLAIGADRQAGALWSRRTTRRIKPDSPSPLSPILIGSLDTATQTVLLYQRTKLVLCFEIDSATKEVLLQKRELL